MAVAATLLALGMADRLLGAWLLKDSADLIFPAFSSARHKSAEFDLSVNINNLGFRGPNTTATKQRRRAVIIGDSFTFGWGVEETETWVHLLQQKFPNWELLNLGQGGTHPGDHVQLARKALQMLQPDLVIVGVLAGNDLHQLMRVIEYERGERLPSFPDVRTLDPGPNALQKGLRRLVPNLYRRFGTQVEIGDRWRFESDLLLNGFSADQRTRYQRLSPEVRSNFEAGLLNPSLIFEAMEQPDAFRLSADTSGALLPNAIERLGDHLAEMRELSEEYEARLLVLGLPNRPYGCAECIDDLRSIGYEVSGCDTLDGLLPLRLAAVRASVQLLIVPDAYTPQRQHYFPFDGHWNARGHRLFAQGLIPQLREVLRPE